MNKASFALIEADQKLVYYHGYKHYQDKYELYDLENDPEELDDRYKSSAVAEEMQTELDEKFEEIKQPIPS